MATDAQIAANQANAQKSTGPSTTAGKAASSQNNSKHGFRSMTFLLIDGEDLEIYLSLTRELHEEHDPQTPSEILLVQKMGQHYWLAERARRFQLGYQSPFGTPALAEVSLWMRYEGQQDRAFHKCLADLHRLREERRKIEKDTRQELRELEAERRQLDKEARAQAIGFERQKQAEAANSLKKEAHDAKVRLATAKAEAVELDTAVKAMIQAPCPGDTPFDFRDLKDAVRAAIEVISAEKQRKAAA